MAWDPIQDPDWSRLHGSAGNCSSTVYNKYVILMDAAISIGHWKQSRALRAAVLGVQLATVYKPRRD